MQQVLDILKISANIVVQSLDYVKQRPVERRNQYVWAQDKRRRRGWHDLRLQRRDCQRTLKSPCESVGFFILKNSRDFPLTFTGEIAYNTQADIFTGKMVRAAMEKSRSWSSAHDWKSCNGHKPFESSNLSFSAMKETSFVYQDRRGFFVVSWGWLWYNHFNQSIVCRHSADKRVRSLPW